MKSYILPIVILLSVIGLIILAIIYSFSDPDIQNRKTTYALIKNFKSKAGSGRVSLFEYTVSNESFKQWGYYNDSYVVGELFETVFDSINPDKSQVMVDKPLFLETEKTSTTLGQITRIKDYKRYSVDFEYSVDGLIYSKTQVLPDNYEELYSDLKTKNIYQVKYLIDNPQRSIIDLIIPIDK